MSIEQEILENGMLEKVQTAIDTIAVPNLEPFAPILTHSTNAVMYKGEIIAVCKTNELAQAFTDCYNAIGALLIHSILIQDLKQ